MGYELISVLTILVVIYFCNKYVVSSLINFVIENRLRSISKYSRFNMRMYDWALPRKAQIIQVVKGFYWISGVAFCVLRLTTSEV